MTVPSSPDERLPNAGDVEDLEDKSSNEDSDPGLTTPVDEECGDQEDEVTEVDPQVVESLVTTENDSLLIAEKIISAERGYTIEQLKKHEEVAWNKACERFLKIAVWKYQALVQVYLPGVDEQDAKSAVGQIVPDLVKKIDKYSSLLQLEKSFRIALANDVRSLLRKFLAKKRGEGKIDVTSELHGLDQADAPISQQTYKDEEDASPSLESKINPEQLDWSATKIVTASASAERLDQKRLMSEAMEELTPIERQMIELSVIGGLKHREIAERMGKKTSQIGIELNRIKEKLRKLISQKMLKDKRSLL